MKTVFKSVTVNSKVCGTNIDLDMAKKYVTYLALTFNLFFKRNKSLLRSNYFKSTKK